LLEEELKRSKPDGEEAEQESISWDS